MSLGVAVIATLAALVLTGMLVRQCIRAPRLDVGALVVAAAAFTISLVAQSAGASGGYTALTFRAVYLAGGFIAPLALVWGMAEMSAKSVESRFSARLGLSGLTLFGVVVLGTDPLSATAFSKSWPTASVYYMIIPNAVLEIAAVVATLAAGLALAVTGVRARRYGAGWQGLFVAVTAAAVGAVATDLLHVKLPVNSAYAVICLLGAALAWFAGRRASGVPLDEVRFGEQATDDDYGNYARYDGSYGTGGMTAFSDDSGYGLGQSYPGLGRGPGDTGARWYRDDTGGFALSAQGPGMLHDDGANTGGFGRYGTDTGGFDDGSDANFKAWFRDEPQGYRQDHGYGGNDTGRGRLGEEAAFQTGDVLSATGSFRGLGGYGMASGRDVAAGAGAGARQLYGQIAIYTLLDGAADTFDQIAQQVVEQVKAREPETLVYVMHGVPSAPMQRILYEVYRDEDAFEVHKLQPHVRKFEEESKPYVLATNVIELGVRHGKFSPIAPPPVRRALPSGQTQRQWGQDQR
ncbi:MAG TPA: antibiotic biosynthesis monooxygenase [Streptosporangiaceae bacterium]|nr:antibiotic biosynthesis monooxygenase [Streptosporangiaceae bacterium]